MGDHFRLTRRDFLRTTGVIGGGLLTGRWPATGGTGTKLQVALAQVNNYDRKLIRQQVQTLLDQLGGLADIVRPGDRVALKPNLTGGLYYQDKAPAIESYITHPEVVRALGEAVLDSGAGKLYIVEGIYDSASTVQWGYTGLADDLGAELIDLNLADPYDHFISQPVGDDWLIYEQFTLNNILTDIDVFMSIPKLKCHYQCGVTISMKNLIGLVPLTHYRLNSTYTYRSALHGTAQQAPRRIPRTIIDLNRARPIHFALVDGIKTSEGGEGPWISTWNPIAADVLIAGKNPLATDAVSTAVMGFDPTAESLKEAPFLYCENHLQLAYEQGLGTNRLDEIEIVGASLEEVRTEFTPCKRDPDDKRIHHPRGVFAAV